MENDNQSNPRIVPFLILSFLIFLGWSLAYEKFFPKPVKPPTPTDTTAVASPSPVTEATPAIVAATPAPATQAELRQLKLNTELWNANISNQGAVITEWTITKFTDGQKIDPQTNGVNLVSAKVSQEQGAFFRFHIPSDQGLEKELNEARYALENASDVQVELGRGQKREISFAYSNNGVAARKKFIFKGQGADNASGFDFDFISEVTRNGQAVDAYVVIGPNYSDHSVVEVSTYKHPPQISYAIATKVFRKQGAELIAPNPVNQPLIPNGWFSAKDPAAKVNWAGVDDNYFSMVVVPDQPVAGVGLNQPVKENVSGKMVDRNYVSAALKLNHGQLNHVYAGPKALDTLETMSAQFGLVGKSAGLEEIVSYGLLDFLPSALVKPIGRFMLVALRTLNQYTHNWGWAIVLLTIALNMIFFPLRYFSSKKMKAAAAMQPQMKALQDEMAKLGKDDPRVMELQKKQLSLMKDANPLMGCLPLLLQMPFFIAVFAVLTVSIEVRHAPFFGWLKDLSAPDPYWLLPIIMCVTMIAQTALT
ncbi:MAG: membrane protein insertase YidC, partial [Acidobacteria bacterium]|nr:membrane protein insertase YidC [Acidobacteriota bacterium]